MINSDVSFEGGRLVLSKAVIAIDVPCFSKKIFSMVRRYQYMDFGTNMEGKIEQ
jgi:hypothetical protein